MGDQAVPLRVEDIQRIGDYVKPWLRELVGTLAPQPAVAGIDAKLLERMVRVEEELKSHRELVDERFRSMDKRFENINGHMDKRFEDIIGHMDDRSEATDKRFALITWLIGIGLATGVAAIGILLGT